MTASTLVSVMKWGTDKEFRNDHLKLCILWYDEIIVEHIGQRPFKEHVADLVRTCPNADRIYKKLMSRLVPLSERIDNELLEEIKRKESHGYPRWGDQYEKFTYPDPDTPEQHAHNVLLKHIEQSHGQPIVGAGIMLAEGQARMATEAVRLWYGIRNSYPCMLQASEEEQIALNAMAEFDALPAKLNTCAFRVFEASVPSLRDMPWDTVLALANDSQMVQLRDRISSVTSPSGDDIELALDSLARLEEEATGVLLGRARPQAKKVAIESILANLPSPVIINPASLYYGIRDYASACKAVNSHGWFYLLRDIRLAANSVSSTNIDNGSEPV